MALRRRQAAYRSRPKLVFERWGAPDAPLCLAWDLAQAHRAIARRLAKSWDDTMPDVQASMRRSGSSLA